MRPSLSTPLAVLLFSAGAWFSAACSAPETSVPAAPAAASPAAPAPGACRYDPEDPRADADGFVWLREGFAAASEAEPARAPAAAVPAEPPTAAPVPAPSHPAAPATGYLAEHYRGPATGTLGPASQRGLTGIFFQMLGGLALVTGLAILGSVLLKRASARGFFSGRGRLWKVIENVPLGPKKSLYVTRFVDRVVLLGATDQQITLLCEIQDPALALAVESGDVDFRRFLVPEALEDWSARPAAGETAAAAGEPEAAPRPRLGTPEAPAPAPRRTVTV